MPSVYAAREGFPSVSLREQHAIQLNALFNR
jgi:hypothetical protein